jgi:Flp pilus assembly protein CpaB
MNALAAVRQAVNDPRAVLARIPARPAGVALLCLATLLAAWMIVPRTGTAPVLVAAHDLEPGTVLTAGDVRLEQYPAALSPDGALTRVPDADGVSTGGAIAAGTPLTSASLLGPDAGLRPPGTVLVPTVFGDAQSVSVIRPGHRLRVFAAGGAEQADAADGDDDLGGLGATGALVEEAVVTAVHSPPGPAAQGSTVVTLAVTEPEAAALSRDAGAYLSFALLN